MKELILSDTISISIHATILNTLKASFPDVTFYFLKIPTIITTPKDGYSYCYDKDTSDSIFKTDLNFENHLKSLVPEVDFIRFIMVRSTKSEFLVYRSFQIIELISKKVPVSTVRVTNSTSLEIKKAIKSKQPLFYTESVLAEKYKSISVNTLSANLNGVSKKYLNKNISLSFLSWALLREVALRDRRCLAYLNEVRYVIKVELDNGLILQTPEYSKKEHAEKSYSYMKQEGAVTIRKHDKILKAPLPLTIFDVLDKWNYQGKKFSEKYLTLLRLFYGGFITNPFFIGTGIPRKAVKYLRDDSVWERQELLDKYPHEYSKSGEPTALLPTRITREELPGNCSDSERSLYKFIRNHALATNSIDSKVSEYFINYGDAYVNVNVVEEDSVNGCNYFTHYLEVFKGNVRNPKVTKLRKSIEYTNIAPFSSKELFKVFDKYKMFSLKEIAIAYMKLVNYGFIMEIGNTIRASRVAQYHIGLIEEIFPSFNNFILPKVDAMFSRVLEVGKRPKKFLDTIATFVTPGDLKTHGKCPKDGGDLKLSTSMCNGYLECEICKEKFVAMFEGSEVKIFKKHYIISSCPYCDAHNKVLIKGANFHKDTSVICSECNRTYIYK